MKKIFFSGCLSVILFSVVSCNDNSKADMHTHEDGSTHADHDTTKRAQEQFNVTDTTHKDTTGKEHTHKDGETHSH